MVFEMLWLAGILLYGGLYLWAYAVNRLPRRRRLIDAAAGLTVSPRRRGAISPNDAPR